MTTVFTSRRERRLWLALSVVLLGIYATLGQAPGIVSALGAHLLESAGANLVFALLILLTAIPIFGIDKRFSRAELAVGAGVLAVYLLVWLRMSSWEARTHLAEYAMVAGLLHEALLERRDNGGLRLQPTLLALVLALLLGALDECAQSLLPNRVFDPVDIAFNSLAALVIIGSRWMWRRLRAWAQAFWNAL